MNFEILSYIFAIALSVSAVISPIATALINNDHQLKINKQNNDFQMALKSLEINATNKNIALDNYLNCLSKYLIEQNSLNLYNYEASMVKVNMFLSPKTNSIISFIDDAVKEKDFKQVSEKLCDELTIALWKENITYTK